MLQVYLHAHRTRLCVLAGIAALLASAILALVFYWIDARKPRLESGNVRAVSVIDLTGDPDNIIGTELPRTIPNRLGQHPSDPAEDHFGQVIRGDAHTLCVAAPSDDQAARNAGALYVYHRPDPSSPWQQHQHLQPSENAGGSHFGLPFAFSGNHIAVAAQCSEAHGTSQPEVVYLFENQPTPDGTPHWKEIQRLRPTAPDPPKNGVRFGCGVALSGDWLAIGARLEPIPKTKRQGMLYLYKRDLRTKQWTLRQKLAYPGKFDAWCFAWGLQMDGPHLLASGHLGLDASTPGEAFCYHLDAAANQWQLLQQLEHPGDYESSHWAIQGDRLAITSTRGPSALGVARIYDYDAQKHRWIHQLDLHSGVKSRTGFGIGLALHGSHVLVGAPTDSSSGPQHGTAYHFALSEPNPNDSTKAKVLTVKRLIPPTNHPNSQFGSALHATAHDWVVGAMGHSDNHPATGAAYVYPATSH